MIFALFRSPRLRAGTQAVYETIVAQSRQPWLYRDFGVPDNVTGRYDMISLHMCLVLHALRRTGEGPGKFSQALFDLFFKDMDRSLREMGVGDIAVPKRISKMGGAFYGLLAAVTPHLDEKNASGLTEVIKRNILDAGTDASPLYPPDAPGLAQYCLDQSAALGAQDLVQDLEQDPSGKLVFAPRQETEPARAQQN